MRCVSGDGIVKHGGEDDVRDGDEHRGGREDQRVHGTRGGGSFFVRPLVGGGYGRVVKVMGYRSKGPGDGG